MLIQLQCKKKIQKPTLNMINDFKKEGLKKQVTEVWTSIQDLDIKSLQHRLEISRKMEIKQNSK